MHCFDGFETGKKVYRPGGPLSYMRLYYEKQMPRRKFFRLSANGTLSDAKSPQNFFCHLLNRAKQMLGEGPPFRSRFLSLH